MSGAGFVRNVHGRVADGLARVNIAAQQPEGNRPPAAGAACLPASEEQSHGCGCAEQERADVLAYLGKRQRAAQVMAARSVEFGTEAHDRARQLQVVIDDISAGLHEGNHERQDYLISQGEI